MLGYIFFRIVVFCFRWIPYRVLYWMSDALFFLFYKIIKYRRRVIEDNIRQSFPEKDAKALELLIRDAYRNFCDILVEGLKGMGLTTAQIQQRFRVVNPELLDAYAAKGQDVLLASAHYANWEWGVSLGEQLQHFVVGPYKPLKNKYINEYVERARSSENLEMIPKNDTFSYMENKAVYPRCLVLVADQSPVKPRPKHWVTFLGRDTAFLHGPDTISRQLKIPLFYGAVQRIRRGHYEVTFRLLHAHPYTLSEGDLTKLYARTLEQQIQAYPPNWLWTHRRWKRKRENT